MKYWTEVENRALVNSNSFLLSLFKTLKSHDKLICSHHGDRVCLANIQVYLAQSQGKECSG